MITTGFLFNIRIMEKVSRKDFNEIVYKKIVNKRGLSKDFDFLSENGDLFMDYRLDSLDVMELIMEFEDIYGIRVDNRRIVGIHTPQDLWNLINAE